ncbi:hypothetical protein I552_4464 [Mycobacterium xenopi 3993]|nr:hypothetical protein I552_4464 [Mycobacterium xenopi 3993]
MYTGEHVRLFGELDEAVGNSSGSAVLTIRAAGPAVGRPLTCCAAGRMRRQANLVPASNPWRLCGDERDPRTTCSFEAETLTGAVVGNREIDGVELNRLVEVQTPAWQLLKHVEVPTDVTRGCRRWPVRHRVVEPVQAGPAMHGVVFA